MDTILDSRFKVVRDIAASSPDPQVAIWDAQHQCVSEEFSDDDIPPDSRKCGNVIIKHQLAGNRGHYSVLNAAFVKYKCANFPHSVIAQITRHRDSAFLVQSNRYTGERFVKVANGDLEIEDVFYFRPLGHYVDREGKHYEYTTLDRLDDITYCFTACRTYAKKIAQGYSEEHARDVIPYNFRQHFSIMGTLEATWHWLDQRSKKDSQLEIRNLAELVQRDLENYTPELAAWYRTNRYGRAILAP